jgi:hypothetical protein
MARILLSIVLGIFTLVVFIGAAESFQGKNPTAAAMAATGLAVALYLAMAQFLVAPQGSRGLRGKWPTVAAMGAPVLAICLIAIASEGGRTGLFSALLMFVPGCLGILIGALGAGRVAFRALSPALYRCLLLVSAALLAAVTVVLAVAIIPLTASAGTFPDGTPGESVSVFWGIVVLNAIVAACLAFFGIRFGADYHPPPTSLALFAFLAFVSTCVLTIPAFAFRGYGPILLSASRFALLCLAAEIVGMVLISMTALRLSVEKPT